MRNFIFAGAAITIFGGLMLGGASAMPAIPIAGLAEASELPIVEAKSKGRGHFKMKRGNRGNHYGWQRGRGNPHRR